MPTRRLPDFRPTPLTHAARLACIASLLASPVWMSATAQAQAAAPAQAQAQVTAQAQPGQQLSEVQVSAERSATTEGTQSYTTRATSTATGLDLSIRDTPQSVSVVTRQRMEDQSLTSITDVVLSTTGLSAKEFDTARYLYSARGFAINSLMIDGVSTIWDSGWDAGQTKADTAIFDRVEVVRGANGLVMGAGNPSAAINMVRKQASSKVFTGTAELSVGSWNTYRGQVDLATPLNADGSVRARVVGAYEDGESFTDLSKHRTGVLYATVEADLTPDTLLRLGASVQDNNPKGDMWGGLPAWYADGGRTDWDRSKTTAADWSSWASTQTNYFAQLEHRFAGGWQARAAVNHGEGKGDMKLLYLSGAPDRSTGLGMFAFPANYETQRTQDDLSLQAHGPFDLLGRRHELGFGLSYSRQRFHADGHDAQTFSDVGDFNHWSGTSYPEPAWGAASLQESFETKQTGAYAVARLSLADPLRLILGARISSYDKSGTYYGTPYKTDYDTQITPYAGLILDLSDTYSVYASYTDIFEPQNLRDRSGKYLDPISGTNYEAGLKGEYLDGRVNASLSVFRIEQDKLGQPDVGFTVPGSNPPEGAYYASQGATSKGYELEVSGAITPDWNLSIGWSQFVASDADGLEINTDHPRRMLKLFTSYRLPGALRGLTLGGGVNWESGGYALGINPFTGATDRLEQGEYALVGLMARYDFNPQLSLQLNVNNVLDEKYFMPNPVYSTLVYGAPRNYTLNMRYRF